MRNILLILGVLLCVDAFANNNSAAEGKAISDTTNINIQLQQLTKLGQGTMKVMFWKVYQAQLFVSAKGYEQDDYPQALKITYLRGIDAEDLLSATDEQWEHLNIDKVMRNKWMAQLQPIFPAVTKQDSIILYVDDKGRSQFYFEPKAGKVTLIGHINDRAFGAAFLSIWLSEKTSRPKFRRQLLGASS